MRQVNIFVILLLLLACSVSAQYTYVDGLWEITGGKAYTHTSLSEVLHVHHTMEATTATTSGMCWAKFVYINPTLSPNYTATDWIMIQSLKSGIIGVLDLTPNYIYTSGSKDYIFSYQIDDSASFNKEHTDSLASLCGSSADMLILTWYGSQSDTYNRTGQLFPSNMLPDSPNAIQSIQSNMSINDKGKKYICFNTSGNVNLEEYVFTTTKFNIFGMSIGSGSNETRLVNLTKGLTILVTCDRRTIQELPLVKVFIPNYGSTNLLSYFPPAGFRYTYIKSTIVVIPPNLLGLFDIVDNWLLDTLLNLLKNYQKFLMQVLPDPIKRVLYAVQEFFNILIMLIGLFISYQAVKYYLNFRKSLKSSLTKSAIIFMEIIICIVISLAFIYTVMHVWSLCTMKFLVISQTLNMLGYGFKVPVNIGDVGAVAWDLGLLSVIGTVSADCTDFYATEQVTQIYNPQSDIVNSADYSNQLINLTCTGASCPSLFIRATIVCMIIINLILVMGIIWTLSMYIFNRVKSLETKVRGPDYEEEEIE